MSDDPCVNSANHPPHSWGNLNWCPGGEGVAGETRHCHGCGEDYDPFAESHVGHEGHEPETVQEALGDVCLRACVPDHHDPACRILRDAIDATKKYRVTFWRHGGEDWIILDTRRDAEAFVAWGQTEGSVFVDAKVCEVSCSERPS